MSPDDHRLVGISRLTAPLALAVPIASAFPLYTVYAETVEPGWSMSGTVPAIMSLLALALTGGLLVAACAPHRSVPAVVNAVSSLVLYLGTTGAWAAPVGAELTTPGRVAAAVFAVAVAVSVGHLGIVGTGWRDRAEAAGAYDGDEATT